MWMVMVVVVSFALVHVAVSALVCAEATSYAQDVCLLGFTLGFRLGLGLFGGKELRKC